MNEKEYLFKNDRYHLERKILSDLWKEDLKTIINDKSKEEQYIKNWLLNQMKQVMSHSLYNSLDELSKDFTDNYVYVMNWWKDLENTRSLIQRLNHLYKLKFTTTKNNIHTSKNTLTKEIIDDVKRINIELVISKYLWKKLQRNWYIKCPFHDDKWPSLKVFLDTNSFYCFWCRAWWTPIEFTNRLLNLSNREAIDKLQTDFIY